jgi:carbonic anhydrase
MITSKEALARLKEGNLRFISGTGGRDLDFEHVRRLETVDDQAPFAIVLGCSDSRVPLELIFDQGMGDLFVIRVAGNIAAASQLGSIEFAAEKFATPLLVVLGHSKCGAVAASVDEVLDPSGGLSPNLEIIIERIRPVVKARLDREPGSSRENLLEQAVGDNVRATVKSLVSASPVLDQRVQNGQLSIVGAEYSLETGTVEFF